MLITEKRLEAETATIQPDIKVYIDRSVTPNSASKVGKYPHQEILKIKFPFCIKKVVIKNGMVVLTTGGTTIIEMAKALPDDLHATFISG